MIVALPGLFSYLVLIVAFPERFSYVFFSSHIEIFDLHATSIMLSLSNHVNT